MEVTRKECSYGIKNSLHGTYQRTVIFSSYLSELWYNPSYMFIYYRNLPAVSSNCLMLQTIFQPPCRNSQIYSLIYAKAGQKLQIWLRSEGEFAEH
jgi:hypothetical protein